MAVYDTGRLTTVEGLLKVFHPRRHWVIVEFCLFVGVAVSQSVVELGQTVR